MTERRDTRIIAGVGIILHVQGKRVPCMTRNVSRHGLFVITPMQMEQAERLGVELVHEGKRLRVRARVARQEEDGFGLTFLDGSAEFQAAIEELLLDVATKKGDEASSLAPHCAAGVKLEWSKLPDGRTLTFFAKRRQRAEAANLSLDGAAVISKKRPEVDEIVLIYLESPLDPSEVHHCRGRVVRHTENGFAVEFIAPRMPFRRAVTDLRKLGARSPGSEGSS